MTVSPRALAREKLLELFKYQAEVLGRKPADEEFFPIDLKRLTGVLLPDWNVRELSDLREADQPISGRTNFDEKIIYVDKTNEPRRRYTLAHELAHVILEHGGCKRFRADLGPRSIMRPDQLEPRDEAELRRERDAESFAAELLMPERTVHREFRRRFQADKLWSRSARAQEVLGTIYSTAGDTARSLATARYPVNLKPLTEFFGVSVSAMRIRLLELSLVH